MIVNCKNVEMTLSRMIDGEVTPDEASAINDHMAQCPACAELHQKMLEVDLRFHARRPHVVSPGFEAALAAKLDRVSLNGRRKIPTLKISALAAGLMVLFVALFMPNLPPEERTPFIAYPEAGLDLKYTPCEDDASCGTQAFCADRNECGIQNDPINDWLTRPN